MRWRAISACRRGASTRSFSASAASRPTQRCVSRTTSATRRATGWACKRISTSRRREESASLLQYLGAKARRITKYMAKQQVYDASAIQALKGLEPVRRMPGMYTHTVHPLHVVQEAIDNAVDEALAGFGKSIRVRVNKDGSIEVEDEGRGIPVDMHPVEKLPAVQVAFTD